MQMIVLLSVALLLSMDANQLSSGPFRHVSVVQPVQHYDGVPLVACSPLLHISLWISSLCRKAMYTGAI